MTTVPSITTFQTTNSSLYSPFNSKISNTTTATGPPCVDYDVLQGSLAALYSIIFILGLAGNLVALWVFFCVHSKKNSVRVFLINIAFADLLLVICLPFRILYHSQGNIWNLHPTLCIVVGNLFYMNMYISVVLLGLISVDRYLKINRGAGMQQKLLSTKWSKALCALIWTVSLALISSFLLSNNGPEQKRCFHYKRLESEKWKAYINMFVVVVFWLVFISLVVSYGKIGLKLLRTSQRKPDMPNVAHYTRTAKKSFFILFVFTVCFVPYHMVRVFYIKTQITETQCSWQRAADIANEVALVFSALNSCLDPVMYFLLSSSVRKQVLRLVSHMFNLKDVAGGSRSSSTDKEQAHASVSINFKEKEGPEQNLAERQ
ncbi:probable G-protein coupled receptor 34 [Anabas testudineus]|uniref:Probable G-protein coupled receptor 34 n=1 Tax=Anabas testudineus TaxID=64144 RepID=A0A3Q1JB52_ANATE|nr:probable G-protein coupled receptor 34 [Anabas testudineus]